MKAFTGVLMLVGVLAGLICFAQLMQTAVGRDSILVEMFAVLAFLAFTVGGYVVARALDNFAAHEQITPVRVVPQDDGD